MTMYNVDNKNAAYLKYFLVCLDYRQSNCTQQSQIAQAIWKSADCLGNLQIAWIPRLPRTYTIYRYSQGSLIVPGYTRSSVYQRCTEHTHTHTCTHARTHTHTHARIHTHVFRDMRNSARHSSWRHCNTVLINGLDGDAGNAKLSPQYMYIASRISIIRSTHNLNLLR